MTLARPKGNYKQQLEPLRHKRIVLFLMNVIDRNLARIIGRSSRNFFPKRFSI
jgi:hypothetical protein